MTERTDGRRARPVQHVIYWDIDGTLLTTARAGVPALEDGAEAAVGTRPDLSGMRTAGLTDRMIAKAILAELGHENDEQREAVLLQTYAAALPSRLLERRGSVLPGVLETLNDLHADDTVANVLLTGNVRGGAEAKLRSYGLWSFFSTGGFSEDGLDRADIARAAMKRAEELHGPAAKSGILIGDTPYDIRAGAEVGLRVLAVASPVHSLDELSRHDPWWVLPQVPSASQLLARMVADA